MDGHNLCQTPTALTGCCASNTCSGSWWPRGSSSRTLAEVRWWVAVVLFVYVDVIGYLPGALAYHRSPDQQVSRVYYVLYNTMHSLSVQGAVLGAWVLAHGWEWALLVLPIHLFGDRALFGNFAKSFTVSFEPVPHPAVQGPLRDFATVPWHEAAVR